MREEKKATRTAAWPWEEWLRQGLLTPEIVARLRAAGRHRARLEGDPSAQEAEKVETGGQP